MTDSIQITTGNDTTGLHLENVEGDYTKINGSQRLIDVPLLRRLMSEKGLLDNPEIDTHLKSLENDAEPEQFQKSLAFLLNSVNSVTTGVMIKWISKMLLG